jgi:hypothetical protein
VGNEVRLTAGSAALLASIMIHSNVLLVVPAHVKDNIIGLDKASCWPMAKVISLALLDIANESADKGLVRQVSLLSWSMM